MLGIRNLTKSHPPRLPYAAIVDLVFGPKAHADVSLVFVGPTRSRSLNRIYRKKDQSANILTFPLDKNIGEILIDLTTARAEARRRELSFPNYLRLLFIHGLLHLKGLAHGSRMETLEENYCHRTRCRHRVR